MLFRGVSADKTKAPVRQIGATGPDLGAIDQPVVALVFGAGLHPGEVRPGGRLGHRHGQDLHARDNTGHPAGLLLVIAELGDVRGHQVVVQVDVEPDVAVAHVLFDDDLLEAEIIDPGTAVLFIGPGAQQPLGAGLQVKLARDHAVLAPLLGKGFDLGLHELAHAVPELFVFRLEDQPLHARSSSGWAAAAAG